MTAEKAKPKPVDHVLAGRVAVRALNRKQPRSAQTFRRSELILARAYLDLVRICLSPAASKAETERGRG